MTPASPFVFFALTGVVSLPFWALGTLTDMRLLPALPLSALMVVAPATAASILVLRIGGVQALRRFWRRSVDAAAMRLWAWVVVVVTMPLVMVLSGAWLLATGHDLPAPQLDPGQLLGLFALFLFAATVEELGWTGYAARALYVSHGLLTAGAILGVATVLWHVIPLLQAGRKWEWIAWWSGGTISRRIIILWLFVHGGQSVFATSLFHAMSNLSWMAFPVMGSHFDPQSVAVIMVLIATLILACRRFRWRKSLRRNP
ncbi:hypothetical protein Q5Y75_16150 [Ruegeria sp. 2205SS24-7]|uniref:CPBP family glutamic-type intramembrane protease n=1 Tax=Ruegeria discodermiae TaxID=3064389 RepID=UPI00274074D5|nr:CPBP family glutamic-type intramembrane protease [Ruegeria sp. 2205SS24-7]MDP5218762.1 hypothetical protein [Ruegeria sp. 2205SS24-7]